MGDVSLVFVGDTALAGPLAADPAGAVARMDPAVRDLLRGDLVVANLECALTDAPAERPGLNALTSPTRSARALRDLGINVVTLANNHVLDAGPAGLASTLEALEAAGIASFGAGMNLEQATRPLLRECRGRRIGFLGFVSTQYPGRNRPGSLPFDGTEARRLIKQTRPRCDALVVYFHEGIEAFHYPLGTTVEACHRAVESGATLVVGTHPHTIQGIEHYRGVPIAYSLGNFLLPLLMDSEPSVFDAWLPETDVSRLGVPVDRETVSPTLVLRCVVRGAGPVEAEAVPVKLTPTGLPASLEGDERARVDALLAGLCEAFRNPDDPVWRHRDDVERGFWRLRRSEISWLDVVKRLHRLRWRHVVQALRLLR